MQCSNCSEYAHQNANFCSNCGTQFSTEEKVEYVGVHATTGIYRITFPPQDVECSCREEAEDIAGDSTLGEDGEFKGNVTVVFAKSTVTAKTHPYVCDCGVSVSTTDEGKCEFCEEINWHER